MGISTFIVHIVGLGVWSSLWTSSNLSCFLLLYTYFGVLALSLAVAGAVAEEDANSSVGGEEIGLGFDSATKEWNTLERTQLLEYSPPGADDGEKKTHAHEGDIHGSKKLMSRRVTTFIPFFCQKHNKKKSLDNTGVKFMSMLSMDMNKGPEIRDCRLCIIGIEVK